MKIINDLPRLIYCRADGERIRLIPGENEIADADWQKVKDSGDVVIKAYLDSGDIKEGAPKKAKASPAPVEDAGEPAAVEKKETAAEMVDKVKACDDIDQLEKWLEGESRITVVTAIEKRIDALEADL